MTSKFYSILISGIVIQLCSSITLDEFYPYGLEKGHQVLFKNDDQNSNEIAISATLPFFDKHFNSLYVNTNGVISFNVTVGQFTPDRFPLGDGRVMIAPFWADVDISRRGDVWYETVTNRDTLKRATKDVRDNFPDFKQFSATWTFVTTWYKVPYYGSTIENDANNTFQSIIITNGRYSFVRFNYHEITWTSGTASGSNSSGLGGVLPECGFNAGDGKYSYSITKPGNISVFDLPYKTNVKNAKAGVWMFRIDNAEIEEGGCSKSGFLTFSDYEVLMFGGRNLDVFGPCFQETDKIACKFAGEKTSPGVYMSKINVRCTPPMVDFIGKATLSLSRDNGETFPYYGIFFYISPEHIKNARLKTYWKNNKTLNIHWPTIALGPSRVNIMIQIARFVWKENAVKFHSFYNISNNYEDKDGAKRGRHSENIVLNKKEVVGDRERFALFLRVIKRVLYKTQKSSHEWLWSKAVRWQHSSKESSLFCKEWAATQPDPEILKDDHLLACPPSKQKVDEDKGRYVKTKDPLLLFGNVMREDPCYITITPSLKNFGQRCCYNKEGNLLVGYEDNGGSLQRVHHEADYPYVTHYFQDVLPYYDCCNWSKSRLCETYYKKRPSDDGTTYTPPRPAATFGEPHMITLDGVQYTFNGYGEYIVLKISNDEFMLQGRMEQLKPINGTSINATVYTAFAMKSLESDAVQIELNDLGDIEVTVNGGERDFDRDGRIPFSNGFIKRRPNTSKYFVTFTNGVRVMVEKETLLLQLMINLPDKFLGNTSGLLGFFDNNKENEFLLPNGTFLKTSSDAKTLHYDFGLKWAVDVNESLFTYYGDRNHSYFHKDNFVPMFFDYDNLTFNDANLEREARRVCQGDVQCLVDAIATGQPSFGVFSRNITNEYKRILRLTTKIDCTPLSPEFPNGLMLRNDSNEGEIHYTFKCNNNSVLNGASEISCNNGTWNGTKPICKDCTPLSPEFPNGLMLRNDSNEGEIHYTFKCNNNFVLNGASVISCKNGTWNETKPSCKDCSPLSSEFDNGLMLRNDTNEGEIRYTFKCDTNYFLNGASAISCKNGTWNGTKPSCKGCTVLSPEFANGLMLRNDSNEREIHYTFKCNNNFVLNGASEISCKNGTWNGTKPSCKGTKDKKIKLQLNNSNHAMKPMEIIAISTACGAVFIAVVGTLCYKLKKRRRGSFNVHAKKNMEMQTQKNEEIGEDNPVICMSHLKSPKGANKNFYQLT